MSSFLDKFAEFVKGYRTIMEDAGPYVEMLRGLSDLEALEESRKLETQVDDLLK